MNYHNLGKKRNGVYEFKSLKISTAAFKTIFFVCLKWVTLNAFNLYASLVRHNKVIIFKNKRKTITCVKKFIFVLA